MHRITGIRTVGRTLVVLLALGTLVALVAPVAQADPWQLERPSQAIGQVSPGLSDAVDRYVANHPESIPDAVDRYVANHPEPIPDALDRFVANDRAHNLQPGASPFAVASKAPEASSGLDWDTFALGFGVGLAACALIAAMLLSLRRRRALVHA